MPIIASLDFIALHEAYRTQSLTVSTLAEALLERLPDWEPHHIWIHRLPPDVIRARAAELDRLSPEGLPLYGIPFAVKDNIDVAGLPTTAAYPEPLYIAERHATVVARLLDAGALLIGKTNLDQFATGLNGSRSPYGACANAFDQRYISGGSSSGSAVAVAAGLVSFALGTDTAGSGRVPAAFNNIVGLKPTRGLMSTQGVLPACRSLDCVSVFALTVADSLDVLRITAGFDAADPFSRPQAERFDSVLRPYPKPFRFGIPAAEQLEFFGNRDAELLFYETVEQLETLGGEHRIVDFEAFLETARLLYTGPWLSERCIAVDQMLNRDRSRLLPVIRDIIDGGDAFSAADGFAAYYRLKQLQRTTEAVWRDTDLLLTPTAGTIYTLAEMQADPITLNSQLGYYTNFMNLLDLSALAVPAGFLPSGLPFGVTLAAPAFHEAQLAAVGAALQQANRLGMGATDQAVPPPTFTAPASDSIELFVCGAHMASLALNYQLTERGASFIGTRRTAPHYRFYALEHFSPPRPGLIRSANGRAIEGELWRVPLAEFGGFVAAIPAPLGIGTVELEDGAWISGFICEGYAAAQGRDISDLGSWRVYLNELGEGQ